MEKTEGELDLVEDPILVLTMLGLRLLLDLGAEMWNKQLSIQD